MKRGDFLDLRAQRGPVRIVEVVARIAVGEIDLGEPATERRSRRLRRRALAMQGEGQTIQVVRLFQAPAEPEQIRP